MNLRQFLFKKGAWAAGILALLILLGASIRSEAFQIFLANSFPSDTVALAKVISAEERAEEINGIAYWTQMLEVRFLTGKNTGTITQLRNRAPGDTDPRQKVRAGETILVAKNLDFQGAPYFMTDRYRLPELLFIVLLFIAAILFFGKRRGLTSLLGLGASITVLAFFIVPQILQGANPLLISFAGAVLIAVASLYLAHGCNRRTTIALVGMLVTLGIAIGLAVAFTSMTQLLGYASEEDFLLKLKVGIVSLHGLFLAGVIIGMLGVLDDVTIGQAATIDELKKANPALGFKELYRHGISVGREHIASLVNTLVLAYAGAAFPFFLLLVVQSDTIPLWLIVNGELIAQEIVRTLVGSIALILAVPITTFLAAYWCEKRETA